MSEYPVTLDSDVTRPSNTVPGHGTADTTDPYEIAISETPRPGDEARLVGTVNAVVSGGRRSEPRTEWLDTDRIERETSTRPNGTRIVVERNLELGDTRVVEELG